MVAYNRRYIQNQPDKKSCRLYTYHTGDGYIHRGALRIKRKIDVQGKEHGSRHGALVEMGCGDALGKKNIATVIPKKGSSVMRLYK